MLGSGIRPIFVIRPKTPSFQELTLQTATPDGPRTKLKLQNFVSRISVCLYNSVIQKHVIVK
jgi:hypothetical protein